MSTENEPKLPTGSGSDAPACSPLRVVPNDGRFGTKAPCPYCGGKITCSANAWEQEDDGSWFATDIDIECSNEPPIDSKRWKVWDREHGRADCNDAWRNLHDGMIRGMKRRFRFIVENVPAVAPATLDAASPNDVMAG